MNKKELSVIVAVYNVSIYLDKLISTLNAQTLEKDRFEIIFVDDNSSDDSVEKIKKLMSSDIDYKVLSKENGGLSDTRNFGILNSSSEYIMFIDGDDYVDQTFLSKMLNKMNESEYDICMCSTI